MAKTVTIAEAAKQLGVEAAEVLRRLHEGHLRGELVEDEWRIPADQLLNPEELAALPRRHRRTG